MNNSVTTSDSITVDSTEPTSGATIVINSGGTTATPEVATNEPGATGNVIKSFKGCIYVQNKQKNGQ